VSCEETQTLLHGYVDGEVDLVTAVRLEHHFQQCSACAQDLAQQQALRTALRTSALYHTPPEQLEARVRSALRPAGKPEVRSRAWSRRWPGLVAASAIVAVILWSTVPNWLGSFPEDQLVQELIAGHVRSLMVDHLTDLSSSDSHTVKPWFEGKLSFSPQVIDLREQGFLLVGGRLDYLHDKPVAALVYQRRQHIINLYSWPAAPPSGAGEITVARQGYQLIHWSNGGMTYWVISNLNLRELQEFVRVVQRHVALSNGHAPRPSPGGL
jgi:anti-sigma factor RsiW